jgi:spermidine synthase
VIISEPSNPWLTGVSNLFTLEFLTMGKSRLKPGGVWGQWVQTYGMAKSDLQTLLATFVEVYPHIVVYATAEGADLVLVGSDDPLVADYDHAKSLFDRWPRVKDELGFVNMEDPLDIVALFQLDRNGLIEAANGSPVNTDDNMCIEYSAPLNLHRSTQSENAQLLEDHARIPFELIEDDVLMYSDLARSYRKLEDWSRAFRAMAAAVERLEPDDVLRRELVAEAEVWYEEMIEALGYEKDVAMDLLR